MRSGNVKDLTQAWDLYYHVFRRISKQLPQVRGRRSALFGLGFKGQTSGGKGLVMSTMVIGTLRSCYRLTQRSPTFIAPIKVIAIKVGDRWSDLLKYSEFWGVFL